MGCVLAIVATAVGIFVAAVAVGHILEWRFRPAAPVAPEQPSHVRALPIVEPPAVFYDQDKTP